MEKLKLGFKNQHNLLIDFLIKRSSLKHSESLVVALDSAYIRGKKQFINKMIDELDEKHPICYIDVWKYDREVCPFIAILDNVTRLLENICTKETIFKPQDSNLEIFNLPFSNSSDRLLIDSRIMFSDFEYSEKFEKEVSKKEHINQPGSYNPPINRNNNGSSLQRSLNEYREKKDEITEAREKLISLTNKIDSTGNLKLPVFIFIDNLDICKPDYGINLLEEIKPLFKLQNFIFILSLNKNQLSNSLKSIYGLEFDCDSYQSSLINTFYKLEPPNYNDFIKHELKEEPICIDSYTRDHNGISSRLSLQMIFNYYDLSLNETKKVIDMLRIFSVFQTDIKMELFYLTYEIIRKIINVEKKDRKFHITSEEFCRIEENISLVSIQNEVKKVLGLCNDIDKLAKLERSHFYSRKYEIKLSNSAKSYQLVDEFYTINKHNLPEKYNMKFANNLIINKLKPFG